MVLLPHFQSFPHDLNPPKILVQCSQFAHPIERRLGNMLGATENLK